MTEQQANDILDEGYITIAQLRDDYASVYTAYVHWHGPEHTRQFLKQYADEAHSRFYAALKQVIAAATFLGELKATRAIANDIADCPCNLIRKRVDHLSQARQE